MNWVSETKSDSFVRLVDECGSICWVRMSEIRSVESDGPGEDNPRCVVMTNDKAPYVLQMSADRFMAELAELTGGKASK